MRRPVSPSPRRSQDTRSDSPPQDVINAQLRRSSSDVSSRPNRFLAKLKGAGTSTSTSSNINTSGCTPSPRLAVGPSHHRTGSNPALTVPASSSSVNSASTGSSKTTTSAREMHRPTPVALAPTMSNPASVSSLSLASTLTANALSAVQAATDPWHMLHVHVLPLFNGEPLRMPIEELNQLVRKHISTVVSRSLPRAITALEQDVASLFSSGMITLNVRLTDVDDHKFLARLAEVWEFFWHKILPYVEGVFHPLQTDKVIQSLTRTPKTNRPPSPTSPAETPTATVAPSVNVRVLALRAFRDSILSPIAPRVQTLFGTPSKDKDSGGPGIQPQFPKLQQMLLVLISTTKPSHSLSVSSGTPTPGEAVVTQLLRALRKPHATVPNRPFSVARLPTFFSGSAPRDRRGRIARKSAHFTSARNTPGKRDREDWDAETPRNAYGFGDDRHREKEIMESLRHTELEKAEENGVDGPTGAWCLGRGPTHRNDDEEDEDEALDWDQAQDVVGRMVGLRS